MQKTNISKIMLTWKDLRRPTIEEIISYRKLKEDDRCSDWSSVASIKTADQESVSCGASGSGSKSNQIKKPKKLSKPATTKWPSLNDCGYDEDDFLDAFRVFDTNGDGRITAKELNHVLKELGIKMTRNEIKKMIGELDK